MKGFLGIDLGSTTTKAVLLAEDGTHLGYGLTNTRANFETASAIAKAGAIADGRLTFLRQSLEAAGAADRAKTVASEIRERHVAAEQRARLSRLNRRCNKLVSGKSDGEEVVAALADLFAKIAEECGDDPLFGEALRNKAVLAAERCTATGPVPYERLVGVFERALVADEADPSVLDPRDILKEYRKEADLSSPEQEAIDQTISEQVEIVAQAGTGYGRHRLPFAKEEIRSEILCHGLGAHATFPDTKTVLDIGGQDTKAIQLDETGLVTSFQMNDRCAAGCGRYLGYVADELGIAIADLGPMALKSEAPAQINSTCTVFAGTEIRERLSLGETREDVVAGLHRAIIVRALSLLARSGGVRNALTFSGGVGKNPAAVKYLRDLIARHYRDITINVSPDSIYNGAFGAALFAKMDVSKETTSKGSKETAPKDKEAAAC